MRNTILFAILCAFALLVGCGGKSEADKDQVMVKTQRLKGDSMVYGLACEGCTDSVVVLLPEDGGDPVTYNIIEAMRLGKVLGKLQIGDRIALVLNKNNKHVADEVVDIDRLEGIWCYIVMPKLRDFSTMSNKQQARIMENMSDSMKETFLIPREYGFYLKPEWEMNSVGYVAEVNSLADESPVIYPELGYYTNWHLWNGKVIFTSGTPQITKDNQLKVTNIHYDTCSIDYLGADSLVLSSDGISRSYYRKNNLNDINKKAKAISAMRSKEALEQTKQ